MIIIGVKMVVLCSEPEVDCWTYSLLCLSYGVLSAIRACGAKVYILTELPFD